VESPNNSMSGAWGTFISTANAPPVPRP
jgi:hypothetical protein